MIRSSLVSAYVARSGVTPKPAGPHPPGPGGTALMEGLTMVSRERGWPLLLQGVPMAFHAGFGDEEEEVFDYRSLQRLDTNLDRKLAGFLVEEGVRVAPRWIWCVSVAHGDREVEVTLERAGAAFARL